VKFEQGAHLVGLPGHVPGLNRHPDPGRETAQTPVEQCGVGLQRRRQLQQDRPQFAAHSGHPLQQAADRLLRVAQSLDVGEESAGL